MRILAGGFVAAVDRVDRVDDRIEGGKLRLEAASLMSVPVLQSTSFAEDYAIRFVYARSDVVGCPATGREAKKRG